MGPPVFGAPQSWGHPPGSQVGHARVGLVQLLAEPLELLAVLALLLPQPPQLRLQLARPRLRAPQLLPALRHLLPQRLDQPPVLVWFLGGHTRAEVRREAGGCRAGCCPPPRLPFPGGGWRRARPGPPPRPRSAATAPWICAAATPTSAASSGPAAPGAPVSGGTLGCAAGWGPAAPQRVSTVISRGVPETL